MQNRKVKTNKYEQRIEATLDLHGFTQKESEILVMDFLQKSREKNLKKILIITGKGLHSEEKAVLRDFVERFLHQQHFNFQRAKYNEGGDGAIAVLL